jgi:hypothetical protein
LGSLYPLAGLRSLLESVADLTAVDTDIFQIPVAEMAQGDKIRLTLTMSDRGGDQAVDEAAEARQKNSDPSPDWWRSVAWCGVEHGHGFSLRKGGRSKRLASSIGVTMHVVAYQDFQRTAIYSPDVLEMRVSGHTDRTLARKISQWGA